MSPRSRHPRNRSLPDGLRERGGYFSWTSPIDGREKGLGRDKLKAIQWARAANVEVQRIRGDVSAAEWVRGTPSHSWKAWLDRYEKLLAERELAAKTRKLYATYLRRARAQWPDSTAVASISTAMVADALRAITDAGNRRTAQAYRTYLMDCFRCAIGQGWRADNPVSVTDGVKHKTARLRLTIEQFKSIYEDQRTLRWLRNAMALALVSGQRREDLLKARRSDIRDGHWWVEQGKTGNRIAIPLALRLDVFGMSLGEVLEQCRGTGILSHYLVHQTDRIGGTKLGSAIWPDTATARFSEAVRRLNVDVGQRSAPTFHEIRSLSKRLYDAQGGVNTQQLLGHKSASSATLYADSRGEWVKISMGGKS